MEIEGTKIDSAPVKDTVESESVGGQTPGPTKDTQEKLLAGKYKDIPNLEKGYKELESEFHRSRSESEAKIKELQERYDQLMAQINWQQRSQTHQEEDLTEEEKLSREIQYLRAKDYQRDLEVIVNRFLDKNPDLKPEPVQVMMQGYAANLRQANPHWTPERILEEAGKAARKDLAVLKDEFTKDFKTTREDLSRAEIPSGQAKGQASEVPKEQTFEEYITMRKQALANTKRLR